MNFSDYLRENSLLILDGPTGTELNRRGFLTELPLWSAAAIWEQPQALITIHEDYIRAGADIITANTFRADIRTFRKAGHYKAETRGANQQAVELARAALAGVKPQRRIWIAGSLSPLEDCYLPDCAPDEETAFREHRVQAGWLADAGVDLLLVETMNSIREASAATRAALATGLAVITSFILKDGKSILSGEQIIDAYYELGSSGIAAFGFNCSHHTTISAAIERLSTIKSLPLIAYANAGRYDPATGWQSDPTFTPKVYTRIAQNWHAKGAKIIGGCCYTTPTFIQALVGIKKSPV